MSEKNTLNQNILRTIALVAFLVGAIGSLYLMFNTASKQKSIILLGLFTIWVVSPFVALFIVNKIFARLSVSAQQLFYWLIIVLTIVSLVAYSGALTPSGAKPAFIFLVMPFVSWLAILTTLLIAKRLKE